VIEGPNGARAELVKAGGAWTVASRGGFPAQPGKVEGLLERLTALQRAAPVATSAEAAARFQVADDRFERRITVEAKGAKVAALLVGAQASMRTVHVRLPGAREVQLAELGAWEVRPEPDDWIDRTVLHIPRDQIAAVTVGDVTLERAAQATGSTADAKPSAAQPAWRVAAAPKGASLDAAAAEALVQAVADLDVMGIASAPEVSSLEALHVRVRRTDGTTAEYSLSKPVPQGAVAEWRLRASTRPETFRVAQYVVDALTPRPQRR